MAGMNWVCLCGTTDPNDVTVCELDGISCPEIAPAPEERHNDGPSDARTAPPNVGSDVNCPGCGRANTPGAANCFRCNDPLPAISTALPDIRLVLPGNMVVLLPRDQTILLGRHALDPIIKRALEPYDQVGRRHAELLITGTAAQIRDLGSVNGTFVNDVRVSPETIVPIGEGLRLRFGKELELALMPGGLS